MTQIITLQSQENKRDRLIIDASSRQVLNFGPVDFGTCTSGAGWPLLAIPIPEVLLYYPRRILRKAYLSFLRVERSLGVGAFQAYIQNTGHTILRGSGASYAASTQRVNHSRLVEGVVSPGMQVGLAKVGRSITYWTIDSVGAGFVTLTEPFDSVNVSGLDILVVDPVTQKLELYNSMQGGELQELVINENYRNMEVPLLTEPSFWTLMVDTQVGTPEEDSAVISGAVVTLVLEPVILTG